KSSIAYAAVGTWNLAQNDLTNAESNFKTAAELAAPRSPQKLEYAQFEIQIGNLPAAKKILEDVAKETPDYVPAWLGLAEIALAEKKFDDCAENIRDVLARDSGNYDASLLSARLHLERRETGEAVAEMERLDKNYPQVPQVLYQLGAAYAANGDFTKAKNS